jgi:hypothetical protein
MLTLSLEMQVADHRRTMVNRGCATKLAAMICLATFAAASAGLPHLLSYQAKNHLGENATVCGVVVSTKYLESKRCSPTLLNLDKPYPEQPFTHRHLGR